MNKLKKLNVLLAITDQLRSKQKAMTADYSKFFSNNQGSFRGERKTFTPKEGMLDDPSKRSFIRIVTTVDEKINYFVKESAEFINALFTQEKTNSSGHAQAELFVDGVSWGIFTSLELLRLKTLLESNDYGDLRNMIGSIPVRTENEIWEKAQNDDYASREIFETELVKGVTKTTEKESYIVEDPNLKNLKDSSNYTPVTAVKNTIVETGDYTMQRFSGEWSHVQRAEALNRRTKLLTAITDALKRANDVEVVESDLKAEKIFNYIFKGKN